MAAPSRRATVHADVGGVARAEVVAGDDDQAGVGGVPEAFGEASSRRSRRRRYLTGSARQAAHRPTSPASASRAAAAKAAACVSFGAIVSGRAKPRRTSVQVDERAVGVGQPHVGEQPAVVVAPVDVALEPDVGAGRQQPGGERRGLRAEALDGRCRASWSRACRCRAGAPAPWRPPMRTSIVSPSTTCDDRRRTVVGHGGGQRTPTRRSTRRPSSSHADESASHGIGRSRTAGDGHPQAGRVGGLQRTSRAGLRHKRPVPGVGRAMDQRRSMMVPVPRPPPQHIVTRP